MANKRVSKKAFIELNGTDWSNYCTGYVVTRGGQTQTVSTFEMNSVQREGGLLDNGATLQMVHPADDSFSLEFESLVQTKITVKIRPDKDSAASATNRQYDFTAVLEGFDTGGNVGEINTFSLSLPADGDITTVTS